MNICKTKSSMEEEIKTSKESQVNKGEKGGKRNLVIKPTGSKARGNNEAAGEHTNKVFFVQSVEHMIIGPDALDNPTIGVCWRRGFLSNKEFKNKVLDAAGDDLIQLRNFSDEAKEGSVLDPHYYDSGLPPRSLRGPGGNSEGGQRTRHGREFKIGATEGSEGETQKEKATAREENRLKEEAEQGKQQMHYLKFKGR
jgi:hypothetical protein